MLIAAVVFLSGAVGFEFLGAQMLESEIVDSNFYDAVMFFSLLKLNAKVG